MASLEALGSLGWSRRLGRLARGHVSTHDSDDGEIELAVYDGR